MDVDREVVGLINGWMKKRDRSDCRVGGVRKEIGR